MDRRERDAFIDGALFVVLLFVVLEALSSRGGC